MLLKVLENNKSKILWEFKHLLPDQPHTAVVKEQKKTFIIDVILSNLLHEVVPWFVFSYYNQKDI